jgi:hypothetical protein
VPKNYGQPDLEAGVSIPQKSLLPPIALQCLQSFLNEPTFSAVS